MDSSGALCHLCGKYNEVPIILPGQMILCLDCLANNERFSNRARQIMIYAREEAQRLNHNYIGSEHILLGIVREGEGAAARVLNNRGVDLGKVRGAVEFIIGRGERSSETEMGLTASAKRIIELAADEARHLGHIGTQHLLLGLLRDEQSVAAGVLEILGIRGANRLLRQN